MIPATTWITVIGPPVLFLIASILYYFVWGVEKEK
jgi:hypothetical protein